MAQVRLELTTLNYASMKSNSKIVFKNNSVPENLGDTFTIHTTSLNYGRKS